MKKWENFGLLLIPTFGHAALQRMTKREERGKGQIEKEIFEAV